MDPAWGSQLATMDPTWLGIIGLVSVLGAVSSIVVLVRQRTPRARVVLDRVARRREPLGTMAH